MIIVFISYIQPIWIVALVNIYVFMLIIMPYILLSHTLILILLMFRTIYIAICIHLRIRGVVFLNIVIHEKQLYTYAHITTSENAYSHEGHAGRTYNIRLLKLSRHEK